MNATSLEELRAGAAGQEGRDERMEQVRQLLFGDHAQEVATRFLLMEARLRELELGITRQLEFIQARLDQLVSDQAADRRATFDELAQHIRNLSDHVAGISRK
jgi:uncharacterized coiled-coil protein SlyX